MIPVVQVEGRTLPAAWEEAVIETIRRGVRLRTAYDKEGDPKSFDVTGTIVVTDPLSNPRIHKNFPGGPRDLESYKQEVLNGIHDHWVDPDSGKWQYTYHCRLRDYTVPSEDEAVDQVEYMVEKLSSRPYSRRAQAITWKPWTDPSSDDPPCLQRLWARLSPVEDGYELNLNTHWRSRDLYKAWFVSYPPLKQVGLSVS